MLMSHLFMYFFFNDTATTEIYTLSLHDALPIFFDPGLALFDVHFRGDPIVPGILLVDEAWRRAGLDRCNARVAASVTFHAFRSEEHTSELQSPDHIVCRLLLEIKKTQSQIHTPY